MIPDVIKTIGIFLARTVFRTQSIICEEFFAKVVESFEPLTVSANNFIYRRLTGF